MSEVILIKEPAVFKRTLRRKFIGERVIGLTLPNTPTITEFDMRISQNASEESLHLDDDMALRLHDFYTRCLTGPPESAPFYDCHSMMWFLSGAVTELQPYRQDRPQSYAEEVKEVQPGHMYTIIDKQGLGNHSMVGTERPDHSLSVLGLGAPLTVAHNDTLVRLYKGERIFRIIPEVIFD